MKAETSAYVDQTLQLVKAAIRSQEGYKLRPEFQQILFEFRPRTADAWVCEDQHGFFFPLDPTENYQFTFPSRKAAAKNIAALFDGCNDYVETLVFTQPGKYRDVWQIPLSSKRKEIFIITKLTDSTRQDIMFRMMRQLIEYRNICLESSNRFYSPFFVDPLSVRAI